VTFETREILIGATCREIVDAIDRYFHRAPIARIEVQRTPL